MADPSTYRPAPGTIPTDPGVYRFIDPAGQVIYVGKAKNLRNRLSNYFQDIYHLHPRTQQMVRTACRVEWTVVHTEVEALQLEYTWIKEFDPRFNVKYRDDKSYPWLAVTMNDEYPRAQVMRGARKRGVRYFGPYGHAWAIRETLDLLLRVFPVRTCSDGVFKRSRQIGRPCLLGYIGKCSAPCVDRVSADEHRRIAQELCDFLAGNTGRFVRRVEALMNEASAELEFERAARLRDDLGALNKALEQQAVVFPEATDADVIAVADDELEAAVQVFHVRAGRIRGQRASVIDKIEPASRGELVEQFLTQFYYVEGNEIPREILVSDEPADLEGVVDLLAEVRGTAIDVRRPQRGDKRTLMEGVERNAGQALVRHKMKRASDLGTRSVALAEIQEALDLREPPLRIECIDISHLAGTDVVGSLVVFEDGLARKPEYRRFAIKTVEGSDDLASVAEVVRRRFKRYLEETGEGPGIDPETGKPRKFAYRPNLLVIDGARPQAQIAAQVLTELGIEDVAVCGLAKRLEEVWLPDEEDPVILPRSSEGLYLLQRVRDEAHRFAISYQRAKRGKRIRASALDSVPGLGATRKAALLAHFGSLKKIKAATADELAAVPGIGPVLAATIAEHLTVAPTLVVDPLTGEVLGSDADQTQSPDQAPDGSLTTDGAATTKDVQTKENQR